jgi:hypothetical protein
MSRSLTASPFEHASKAEADELWTAEVAPALADIEDTLTDHGLVRELARSARQDAARIVLAGPALLLGLQQLGHLSATISTAITASSVGAGVVGRATNQRQAGRWDAKRAELFYLYQLGPGRERTQ